MNKSITPQKELEVTMLAFKIHGDQPFKIKNIDISIRYMKKISDLKHKLKNDGKEGT